MSKNDNHNKQWNVYVLRCSDNSLYTGTTTDVARRTQEHNRCNKKGAKYTRSKRPVVLVYYETYDSKTDAYRREYDIKCLSKAQKEKLILKENTTSL